MNELARTWIRRIAMGLPIAPAILASGCWCSDCGTYHDRFAIDEPTAAAIIAADHDQDACNDICGDLEARALADGGPPLDAGPYYGSDHGRAKDCNVTAEGDTLFADCEWYYYCIGGRRPAGLIAACPSKQHEAGAWLARMAWMEAASVHAFEELAQELARFDAPKRLIAGARRAAGEERRHAQIVGALSRARGVTPAPVVVHPAGARSLLEMASENAAEGGVRETYGALVAAHQAAHAHDRDVRAAMASIAREEATHALLSDEIDRWARTKIAEPDALEHARAIAAREMRAAVRNDEVSAATAHALGLPNAIGRARLLAALA